MYKKAISSLLILAMLFCSVNKLVVYAGYELNKNYISNTLCENRAKPQQQCQGKCFLTKKLKQAEKSEQKQGSPSKHQVEAFIVELFQFRFFTFKTDEYSAASLSYPFFTIVSKIFQPPRF